MKSKMLHTAHVQHWWMLYVWIKLTLCFSHKQLQTVHISTLQLFALCF